MLYVGCALADLAVRGAAIRKEAIMALAVHGLWRYLFDGDLCGMPFVSLLLRRRSGR